MDNESWVDIFKQEDLAALRVTEYLLYFFFSYFTNVLQPRRSHVQEVRGIRTVDLDCGSSIVSWYFLQKCAFPCNVSVKPAESRKTLESWSHMLR